LTIYTANPGQRSGQERGAGGITVRERVDLGGFGGSAVDAAEAGEGVLAVDVHGAGAADAFAAGKVEGGGRVEFVLDFDEGVEDLGLQGGWGWKGHGTGLVEVDGVGLEVRFGCRFIWGRLDRVEREGWTDPVVSLEFLLCWFLEGRRESPRDRGGKRTWLFYLLLL
jgi:hypothetical protein